MSLIFMPLGFALAPPLANAVGTRPTLLVPAAVIIVANAGLLLPCSVRRLERRDTTG